MALALACAIVACGSEDDDRATPPSSSSNFTVTISAADRIAIGPSRFVFVLEDARGQPVTNASVHLRFYFIDPVRDDRKTVKNELNATPVELDDAYELTREDGTTVTVGSGPTGIFADNIAFDQAGDWVVDITGTAGNDNLGTIEVPFSVGEVAIGPQVGNSAPAIEDGSVEGPAMVIFGKAGVCGSAVCGPLVDVVRKASEAHSDEIDTHYAELSGEVPEWMEAWGVGEEPVVFFVDSEGIVRGSLHTIATLDQVEALALLLLP